MADPLSGPQQLAVVELARRAVTEVFARGSGGQLPPARFLNEIEGELVARMREQWGDADQQAVPAVEVPLAEAIADVISDFGLARPTPADVQSMFRDEQRLVGSCREWGATDTEYRDGILQVASRFLTGRGFPAEGTPAYEPGVTEFRRAAAARGWAPNPHAPGLDEGSS